VTLVEVSGPPKQSTSKKTMIKMIKRKGKEISTKLAIVIMFLLLFDKCLETKKQCFRTNRNRESLLETSFLMMLIMSFYHHSQTSTGGMMENDLHGSQAPVDDHGGP